MSAARRADMSAEVSAGTPVEMPGTVPGESSA
jgi:hypothetical protein